MKTSFPISQLEFRDGGMEEQYRTRVIFETLRTKARKNEQLNEHEKDFLFEGLILSNYNDGAPEDFPCCDNPKFKSLYLCYYHDLSGASPVYKVGKLKLRLVDDQEKYRDLKYLQEKQSEWKTTIYKLNHNESLLQEASFEARQELKNFKDSKNGKSRKFKANPNFTDDEIEREILLKSKYIYCVALKMFEKLDRKDLKLVLNKQTIEVNEYSIIHILNRHFASKSIYYVTGKSNHTIDFEPSVLNLQLKEILRQIDITALYQSFSIDKIAFQFKGIDYQIWTGFKKKFVKGKEIQYRRLNSFFIINDNGEKKKLLKDHKIVDINLELKLYLPKQANQT